MNRKKFVIFLCVLCVLCVKIYSQTAAQMDTVLAAEKVTCGQAAYFVMQGESNAYQQAAEKNWLKADSMETPITMGQLSFLIMKSFDIKGGLMYTLAPSPRYAYRSMTARRYIQGASDPALTVSGEDFLLILGRVLNDHGGEQ